MILADTSAWVEYLRATGSATDRRVTELIGGDIRACRAHRPMRGARFEVVLPLSSSAS